MRSHSRKPRAATTSVLQALRRSQLNGATGHSASVNNHTATGPMAALTTEPSTAAASSARRSSARFIA